MKIQFGLSFDKTIDHLQAILKRIEILSDLAATTHPEEAEKLEHEIAELFEKIIEHKEDD